VWAGVGTALPDAHWEAPWPPGCQVLTVGAVLAEIFRPWRRTEWARTWWALVHVLSDAVVASIPFMVTVSLLATSAGLIITFPLAIPTIWLLFVLVHLAAYLERARFAALLGVVIEDPVPLLRERRIWGRWVERLKSWPRWREMIYMLIAFPLGLFTSGVAALAWCGSAALLFLPLYVGTLPGDTAKFWLFELGTGPEALLATLVGISGLAVAAPWVTRGLARLDTAVAQRMLGVRRKDEMRAKVRALETSRAAAVDSAETERRRIERDLHDGAQQRLVSLAMGLGAARQRLEDDPEGGARMVAEAHEDAKAALKEIRDLVRGIHPVILEDRGLDAALSAVVARSPVPVTLQVDVPERPPPTVESAAYFVVSEALTNVARHARAREAHVAIVRVGDRLVVEVRDDGMGGADPELGTGLAGLRSRVTGMGGRMDLVSPAGGPTTLLVELPCAS
jgi:signal transduction histidine kinase